MARCTRHNIMWVCQWLATGPWFSPGTLVSSTNITDCHNITKILLKMGLNTSIWLITRLLWRVALMEQELPTLPEYLSFTQFFSGVRVTRSLAGCQVILYSYIFSIFSRFCYNFLYFIPKSYIFPKLLRQKSWIFNFEWKFHINMTNRGSTRY